MSAEAAVGALDPGGALARGWGRPELRKFSLAKLKALCSASGLPVSGNKDQLSTYLIDPAQHRKRPAAAAGAAKKRAATKKTARAPHWVKGTFACTSGGSEPDRFAFSVATKSPASTADNYHGWGLIPYPDGGAYGTVRLGDIRERESWIKYIDEDGKECRSEALAAFVVSKRAYQDLAEVRGAGKPLASVEGPFPDADQRAVPAKGGEIAECSIFGVNTRAGTVRCWEFRNCSAPSPKDDALNWGVAFRCGDASSRVSLQGDYAQGCASNAGGFDALARIQAASKKASTDESAEALATEEPTPLERELYDELEALTADGTTACLQKLTSGVDGGPIYVATYLSSSEAPPPKWTGLIKIHARPRF
ncbi:hypothetical protein M885DRAFT_511647 [Pelagophyceae sp. CCMP2097]|nr:hypothetical protein M885DRAFT_511647 [Pelagophyceae sp. CCMP2097]|mmetsp:Transcript_18090/g.64344  ORF Transcript_18090/g.64344 Transcript_18090/m.64344 type:complete len:365 (+) Transcript_18090:78-1172(+)